MVEILLIAVALAMDCFAVSVVCGVILRRTEFGVMTRLALLFGLFQALMPLIGWLLTSHFSAQLESVDHWIAFALLAFIGGRMIYESFHPEVEPSIRPREWKTQLALAFATSIDALAVGITFACAGYATLRDLRTPLLAIGVVSFLFSIIGYFLGVRFGETVNKKMHPELLGGLILVGIGLKILIEHLTA